nr:MAG TPA: hypothetical protein [Caudoviricetes sp.]
MSNLNDIVKKYGVGESVGIKLKKEKSRPNHSNIYTDTINEYGMKVSAENANLKSAINEILDVKIKH